MELMKITNDDYIPAETQQVQGISSEHFIAANTKMITTERLRDKCIIPVFAKDNESTISHVEFINAVGDVVSSFFRNEQVLQPSIRVSHPIKGRIPEAMGKPAKELTEQEKTLYYERMAFMIEVPSIRDTVDGNDLSLSIGGVRAYNQENLFSKKTEEKFKIFIGFKNWVCCNLLISTDGVSFEVKARSPHEIVDQAFDLINEFNVVKQLEAFKQLPGYALTESQFAQLVGRVKMYHFIPGKGRRNIPPLKFGDSQINMVVKDYYQDESFCRDSNGNINLWNLYNLFTSANKSSYIDTFLDRGVNALTFSNQILGSIRNQHDFWYLG